ncbi:MAG TPA: F0F1 ATP synthase subunit B [Candidatus Baltobacteraceae bacterium]|nr:F0F1 ATP synthase subunit B [Candidatus Baltobacteraceae bacterium]
MEEVKQSVLGALGIDLKLFIAQLVNFSVVLFVMWKWVYTPLLKIIDTRTAKIDKGLKDAEAAEAAKSGAEKASEEAIVAARREAQRILEEAQKAADAQRAELKSKTQSELAALVQQGKDTLAAEKEKMVREARAEIAELAVMAAGKALGQELTGAQRKAMLDAAAKHVEA